MKKIRIISRIDVKNDFAIKGIHLEGLRKVGKPNDLALKYYEQGVDEIVFMDAVAAYYDRNSLSDIIDAACQNVFVPITVGGGIRTIEDIQNALKAGADKVAINTQALKTPEFIDAATQIFGSQCIVISIEAKKVGDNKWTAYFDNGREPTEIDVLEWAKEVEKRGAGEIMLTSIDAEGTKKGFELELVQAISEILTIPLIVSGGAGNSKHICDLFAIEQVDAVALASVLHYDLETVRSVKTDLAAKDLKVRV